MSNTPLIPGETRGTILLFGGTFDPVTRAHVGTVGRARDAVTPDAWIAFVPAARSPHKDEAPAATDAQRVRMLRLATQSLARATVWTDELDRARAGEPSYSIVTVKRAKVAQPDATLRLVIGADQAAAFHRWRDGDKLMELAPPLVLPRSPIVDRASFEAALRESGAWSGEQVGRWLSRLAPIEPDPMSATDVREVIAARGIDALELDRLLDSSVREYIRTNGLYR